jgi:hypothetical protein
MIAASVVYTTKQYGPDRVVGFSPIPAMSQISYAAGSRFLSLLGGVVLSFYDWYCDLPPASPEVWGEQTDVHESVDGGADGDRRFGRRREFDIERVGQRDGLEDGAQVVVAVGAPAEHPEVEIDFRERAHAGAAGGGIHSQTYRNTT